MAAGKSVCVPWTCRPRSDGSVHALCPCAVHVAQVLWLRGAGMGWTATPRAGPGRSPQVPPEDPGQAGP